MNLAGSGWQDALTALLNVGETCVLVTVADVRGSAPRERGTTMLVTAHACVDTIGGGTLEHEAVATARAALTCPAPTPWRHRYPLGPALGQCCGGQVTLLYEVVVPQLRPAWLGLQTRTVQVDGAPAFVQALHPPSLELLVFGAGHVGKAVVAIAAMQPWRVQWVDSRIEQFPDVLPPRVTRRHLAHPVSAVDDAPAGAAYLVMTHSHPLDLELTAQILARGDARYVGLIGSATKRRRFDRQLAALGLEAVARHQLRCPIGLGGITSRRPAAIAVATVAELLAMPPLSAEP